MSNSQSPSKPSISVGRFLPPIHTVLDIIQHKGGEERGQEVNGVVMPRVLTRMSVQYRDWHGRTIVVIGATLVDSLLVPMNAFEEGCEIRYFRRERDANNYWISHGERICGPLIDETKGVAR